MSSRRKGMTAAQKRETYKVANFEFKALIDQIVNELNSVLKFTKRFAKHKKTTAALPSGKVLDGPGLRHLQSEVTHKIKDLAKYHAQGKHAQERIPGTSQYRRRMTAAKPVKFFQLDAGVVQDIRNNAGLFQANQISVGAASSGATSRSNLVNLFYSYFDIKKQLSNGQPTMVNRPIPMMKDGRQLVTKTGKLRTRPNALYNLTELPGLAALAQRVITAKGLTDVSVSAYPLTRVQSLITEAIPAQYPVGTPAPAGYAQEAQSVGAFRAQQHAKRDLANAQKRQLEPKQQRSPRAPSPKKVTVRA